MELMQIRYFLEAARTKHMTNSAKNLHITQPALTQAIRRLEKDLGVPLFAAKGRKIVLTEYGKYLQRKLEPLMSQMDAIPEQLKMMVALEGETIHMNVLAASGLVMEAIIEYKKEHEDINFQLQQNSESELYDIAVTTKLFYQGDEESCFACGEEIYLAVPENGKYRGRTSICLSETSKEGFISLLGSREFRYICDRFCQHAGFTPKIIFESDNPSAVKNMIAANMGIGFWPEFTWGSIDNERVRLLKIEEPICRRDIIINYNRNKMDSRNVIEFYEFLTHFFERRKGLILS
ncbi:MAG: LysR family transcriptional regulator [Dorea sp.]|jgi:DNA-binding transcriptional LysR family regulator|uniref:LysR family transcriptional regulator n=1 Tax=Sporofaciens musculi TaxID=2681861 RepID=UPI0021714498|nr:LysR family transcriptional regulator [Sporofaciens musculi]MCI9421383.1 LysR family transcriptional regulator [Dorea sp.]